MEQYMKMFRGRTLCQTNEWSFYKSMSKKNKQNGILYVALHSYILNQFSAIWKSRLFPPVPSSVFSFVLFNVLLNLLCFDSFSELWQSTVCFRKKHKRNFAPQWWKVTIGTNVILWPTELAVGTLSSHSVCVLATTQKSDFSAKKQHSAETWLSAKKRTTLWQDW